MKDQAPVAPEEPSPQQQQDAKRKLRAARQKAKQDQDARPVQPSPKGAKKSGREQEGGKGKKGK